MGLLCVHAKSLQSCLALWDSMDCRPPDSSVRGILQARILEWVAMPSSRGNLPDAGIEPGSPALQEDSLSMNIFNFLNIIKPAQSKV